MNLPALAEEPRSFDDHRVVDLPLRKTDATAPNSIRVLIDSPVDGETDRAVFQAGLVAKPASSSPKFFYDEQGSALFTAICELEEYYPTRTEAAIFERHRADIADVLPDGAQWIDLGCGDGLKARDWLEPAGARRYVGVDIAEPWLRSSLESLALTMSNDRATRPRMKPIEVLGVVTDFTRPFDLHHVLAEQPSMPPVFFYPGSSIGNFSTDDARAFLASVREHIARHPVAGGKLLIGVDLVKDRATLEAAYDDAIGVTAAFNRNVLRVANRLLDADFDPAAFDHRAVFDETFLRVEMQLVARGDQIVHIGKTPVRFDDGEAITTEYSHKYTVDGFASLLQSAGFAGGERLAYWCDEREWFGVFVAEPG